MRLPIRKKEKDQLLLNNDDVIYLTQVGYNKLCAKLTRLRQELPALREELSRTREMGDLSENAAYQIAKHKLRKADNSILRIEEDLKKVIIIEDQAGNEIQLGSRIIIKINDSEREVHIVGSREANPMAGRISQDSPLGQALLHHQVGDKFSYSVNGANISGEIIRLANG